VSTFEANCPITAHKNKTVNWWNSQLASLRKEVRALFKVSRRTGCWVAYHRLLTAYNIKVRQAKRHSWHKFCSDISKEQEASRLRKVLAKEHISPAGLLRSQNGEFIVSPPDTLGVLLGTHFPGCLDKGEAGPDAV